MEIQPVSVQQEEAVTGPAVTDTVKSSATDSGNNEVAPGGALGKDEFLKLLIAQMQNQDPLDPMDNSEMIAQLAQFSALEQMQNLNTSIDAMKTAQNMLDALLLQGKNVTIEFADGSTVTGTIEKVLWSKGVMELQIDGTAYSTADIASIALSEESETSTTEATKEYE